VRVQDLLPLLLDVEGVSVSAFLSLPPREETARDTWKVVKGGDVTV
jgi:hypothetical protein